MYIPEIPPPMTTTSQDMGRKEDSLKQPTEEHESIFKVEQNNMGFSAGY